MEANEEGDAENALEDVDNVRTAEEITEPPTKKLCEKVDNVGGDGIKGGDASSSTCISRLGQRLATVLCCTVCLDLPVRAVYQVS